MDEARRTGVSLLVLAIVGAVCIVGVAMLLVATWLAWPDDGGSTYSTAANVAQLALVLAGVAAASLSVRAVIVELGPSRALLPAAAALGFWALWWVLFPVLGVGDSTV
jgi:hypothetical protein